MRIRALQHLKAGIKTFIRKIPSKYTLRDGDEVYVLAHNKLLRLVVKQNNKLWFGLFKDEVPKDDHDYNKLKVEDIQVTNPSDIYNLSHDSFADYAANEHINWTDTSENLSTTGYINCSQYKVSGTNGITDTFDTGDGRVATVTNGIITDIS